MPLRPFLKILLFISLCHTHEQHTQQSHHTSTKTHNTQVSKNDPIFIIRPLLPRVLFRFCHPLFFQYPRHTLPSNLLETFSHTTHASPTESKRGARTPNTRVFKNGLISFLALLLPYAMFLLSPKKSGDHSRTGLTSRTSSWKSWRIVCVVGRHNQSRKGCSRFIATRTRRCSSHEFLLANSEMN